MAQIAPFNQNKSRLQDKTQLHFQYLETIRRLYHKESFAALEKIISRLFPSDIAHILEHFPHKDALRLFLLIHSPRIAASTLKQFNEGLQSYILQAADITKIIPIIEELAPDDRADIISQLSPELAKRFMGGMDEESLKEVEELLQYAPDTAGGIMTSQFFALPDETTVGEAIEAVRKLPYYEMIFYLYVLDQDQHLVGVSSLRQLILADPQKSIGQIMNTQVIRVRTNTSQTEVSELVRRHRLLGIPVVDDMDILVGLVTVDDVIDAIEQDMADDMLNMAGTNNVAVMSTSFVDSFKARMPWLFIAVIGGLAASGVIDYYSDTVLAKEMAMSAFLPIIMNMTGNVGMVAATVTVRGLTTGTIKLAQFTPLLLRELGTGLLLGSFYGAICGAVAWFMFGHHILLGQIVGLTILVNMIMAPIIALIMPMLSKKLDADPAGVTGRSLTTLLDILGVVNYFVIATLLMGRHG
ncbi:MAG: magnesium transporter [Magnetococcales bacterium]|nr:magnesium transporter [Magnetococcales bacterium]